MTQESSLLKRKNHDNSRSYASRRSLESRLEEIQALLDLDLSLRKISNMTGLSYGTVRNYASMLKSENDKTVKFKNYDKCNECGSTDIKKCHDRSIEHVCENCGLVLGKELEYGEGYSRFVHQKGPAPVCSLSFGKSLGNTLQYKDLYRVLAKAKEGKTDLPIRARHIQTLIKYPEHPKIRKLLEWGSKICNKHGLQQDHVFAETYGNNLRKIGAFYAAWKKGKRIGSYKHIASPVFYLTLKKFDPEKAEGLKDNLSLREKDLGSISNLLTSLEAIS